MSEFLYLDDAALARGWNGDVCALVDLLEREFCLWDAGRVLLPEKASQIIDEDEQSRVNCMPATLLEDSVSGVKLVSVFPSNPRKGLPNVSGLMVLLSAMDGRPLAVMDAAFVTALRTALVGGLAARELAPKKPRKIALLGSGQQARAHLLVFASLYPELVECHVASRLSSNADLLASDMAGKIAGMDVLSSGDNYEEAVVDADIVVTAISGQAPILRASWLKEGCFYCHVGGWEDEYAVALRSTKIVCDSWDALKHRGSPTIARMFAEGILSDEDIHADLADVLSGRKAGRESEKEIIYFNSIGLAFTDLALASELFKQCQRKGLGLKVSAAPGVLTDCSGLMDQLAARSYC